MCGPSSFGERPVVVPDNLKSGVKAPCYYEPELNRTYGDLAIHYGLGILPARPYHPRDKSKAEVGVQVVQRWVLAALRKRQFFSLSELNEAILELVHKLNERPFRKMAGSRAELYHMIDRPALQPLPAVRFVYAEWKKARVNLDYHVELDQHYYSTPYQLVGKEVDVRSTSGTVEIFYQGKRVASHARDRQARKATTEAAHRPQSHRQYLEWTPTRIVEWAGKVGPLHGAVGGGHPDQQAASGDGVPLGSGRDPAGAQVWCRTAGSGLDAGGAVEVISLPKREIDVEERPGPPAAAGVGADSVSGGA